MLKIALLFLLIPFMTYSQNQDSISIIKRLEEVNVNAIRANSKTPIAFTNINKNQIINKNLGQDLPIIVSMSPSLVTTSDAGAGVGYTSLRIMAIQIQLVMKMDLSTHPQKLHMKI